MKKVILSDDAVTIQHSVDVTAALMNAQRLRETAAAPMADSVCIGSIDAQMLYALAAKAGVRPDDTEAFEDFAVKVLTSRDFSKFRVYEGKA